MKKILALAYTRNLEFVRDKEGLAWNLFVPLFLLLALQLIFTSDSRPLFTIGVLGEEVVNHTEKSDPFFTLPHVKYIYFKDEVKAKKQLEQHQIVLLLNNNEGHKSYWVNDNSEEGKFLDHMIQKTSPTYQRQVILGVKIRYLDWVLPGVLAVNMMYSCLYGIGYGIIRYRRTGYLKRLQSTPITAFEFLCSQILSRLLITQCVVTFIFLGCWLFFSPRIEGSLMQLFCLSLLGGLCLISVALFISARAQSEELSRGLLEMAAWPMLMLSGAFFSLDEAHPALVTFANCLPLTHIISAGREILLYGATWTMLLPHYLTLILMTAVLLLISSKLFRWQVE